jgi:hypothetical protein
MSRLDLFMPLSMSTGDFMAIVDKMSRGPVNQEKYLFKVEILLRLRWNIFGDLANIEVEEGLDDNGIERRSPLSSHTIATESLTSPPIYKLEMSSGDLDSFMFHGRSEEESPQTCMTSDTPITILDFVTAAHAFFKQHEVGIRASRTPFADRGAEHRKLVNKFVYGTFVETEDTGVHPDFYFKGIWSNQKGEDVGLVSLRTVATGEFGRTNERLWEIQRRDVAANIKMSEDAAVFEVKYNTPDRIRQDLLFRLRWDIGEPLENIELDDGFYKDGVERRKPFLSSDVAEASLADPPVSHVTILLQDVLESQSFEMNSDKYPYEPLTIHNTDRKHITVKDFVTQLHAHFNEHRAYIYRYQDTIMRVSTSGIVDFAGHVDVLKNKQSAQPALFFRWAFSRLCEGTLAISVKTMIEGELGGIGDEVLWHRQKNCAAACREVRRTRGMECE